MSNNQIIINNIRRLIRLKGLKQCAVAEKAGFSPNAFSAMLTERKAIMAEYIVFDKAYYKGAAANSSTKPYNGSCVPLRIYGIRK